MKKIGMLAYPVFRDSTRKLWKAWSKKMKEYDTVMVIMPSVSMGNKISYLEHLIDMHGENIAGYELLEKLVIRRRYIDRENRLGMYKKCLSALTGDDGKKYDNMMSVMFRYDLSYDNAVARNIKLFKKEMRCYSNIKYIRIGGPMILQAMTLLKDNIPKRSKVDVFGIYGNRCVSDIRDMLYDVNIKARILPELCSVMENTYSNIWKITPEYPRVKSGEMRVVNTKLTIVDKTS